MFKLNEQKEFEFSEISIGQKDSFEIIVSESLIQDFANISGDTNPLHMDEKYAKNTRFEKRVCHGMLLASFFSKLIGVLLPGKKSLYFSQSLNFQNPCFIGDKVTVIGEVFEKSEAIKMVSLNTKIMNMDGKCLVEGVAKVIIRD